MTSSPSSMYAVLSAWTLARMLEGYLSWAPASGRESSGSFGSIRGQAATPIPSAPPAPPSPHKQKLKTKHQIRPNQTKPNQAPHPLHPPQSHKQKLKTKSRHS